MEDKTNYTDKNGASTTASVRTWLMVIVVLGTLIGVLIAHEFYPDNPVSKILWYLLWLGVLPILLAVSYSVITKKNSGGRK